MFSQTINSDTNTLSLYFALQNFLYILAIF